MIEHRAYQNGTINDPDAVSRPCFACGAKVFPWICKGRMHIETVAMVDKRGRYYGKEISSPLIVAACQRCHVCAPSREMGFGGGTRGYNPDPDCDGGWANVVKAYEEES